MKLSAGGQFTARFLVTHPETVKEAVITAAASPRPTYELAWPYGLGEIHTDIEWDAETVRPVDIVPDKQKWLAATQVPLAVIVGLDDIAALPEDLIPGQRGSNRLFIARHWIEDMAAFAEANGLTSHFTIDMITGKGHTMSGLLSFSQAALIQKVKMNAEVENWSSAVCATGQTSNRGLPFPCHIARFRVAGPPGHRDADELEI